MEKDSFTFKVGDYVCTALCDGFHAYTEPVSLLFPGVPSESLKQVLSKHNLQPAQWEEFVSPYICLLVNTGENLVLIDTGAGPDLGPDTGKLFQRLEALGVSPGDIGIVVLTHGHPDHIGGNITTEMEPAFPNARYVMCKAEWDFWTSGQLAAEELSKLGLGDEFTNVILQIAQKNLLPIKDQLDLVEKDTEITPGIQAVVTPGHTPGHLMIIVSSKGEQLFYISDAFIHPVHLERPDWHMAVDLYPGQNVSTRRQILERAANEKALVHAFHFPFPGIGHLVPEEQGWKWQPVAEHSL